MTASSRRLQVADLVRRSGRTLADLAAEAMHRLPQVLLNVPLGERAPSTSPRCSSALGPAVDDVERRLGEEGRVLIRPSGTEPLIRVMVEAAEATDARALASELVAALRREAAAAGDDSGLTRRIVEPRERSRRQLVAKWSAGRSTTCVMCRQEAEMSVEPLFAARSGVAGRRASTAPRS